MTDGSTIELRLTRLAEEMKRGFSDLQKGLAEVRGHVSRVHKRRELTEPVKKRHLAAVFRSGGMCPCCREVKIVDDAGQKLPCLQWDHWKSPGSDGIKATWPVCAGCNCRLEDPGFKGRKQSSFASYQDLLSDPDNGAIQGNLFSPY